MIRDLTEISINMVKTEHIQKVQVKAKTLAEDRLLDYLLPAPRSVRSADADEEKENYKQTRERLREQLLDGKLDSRYVDI
jgi:ATP-dependent HslUV protease ATP-binding subunit HslU